jgi:hypothetical protein
LALFGKHKKRGELEVEVEVTPGQVVAGDVVEATVRCRCAEDVQVTQAILTLQHVVRYQRYTSDGDGGTNVETRKDTVPVEIRPLIEAGRQPVELAAGEVFERAVSFKVPPGMAPTVQAQTAGVRWEVDAQCAVERRRRAATASAELTVLSGASDVASWADRPQVAVGEQVVALELRDVSARRLGAGDQVSGELVLRSTETVKLTGVQAGIQASSEVKVRRGVSKTAFAVLEDLARETVLEPGRELRLPVQLRLPAQLLTPSVAHEKFEVHWRLLAVAHRTGIHLHKNPSAAMELVVHSLHQAPEPQPESGS